MIMLQQPKFVSFFAGARGLDLGLEQAGWKCIAANEYDRAASDTIRLNEPDLPLYSEDVRNVTGKRLMKDLGVRPRELYAVVGGPPCQAFSTAGRRLGLNDERGNVFFHFLDLIAELQPKYAIFENVRGLLSAPLQHRPHNERGEGALSLQEDELPGGALKVILARLKSIGFEVTFNLYNTANFGVPQSRERLIFIASRDGKRVPHLTPTHDAKGASGLLPWVTFREAVAPLKSIDHHFVNFPAKRLEYYKLLAAGENWRSLPPELQAAAMGDSYHSGGGKTGFYRRLSWDKPSPTLVTRPNMKATDLCHPTELRPLSVEEYAAIQTFPPSYRFAGRLDDQYRQIGNAVPCHFAQQIAHHIRAFEEGKFAENRTLSPLSRYSNTDEASWIGAEKNQRVPNLFENEERLTA
ncbi:DNA cytosine methyltransferase [Terriglobus saanensis]|uniref:DNA (cytosine-5-)-methyltransferase n=1 Tax=Terriglobus saanensis (strain ATCC BAA-1853 / DSM 23119 / SP1PR4) TaxID=401053 RepID=E8V5B1_TERSS|nr:DNA cytosine methyltransferase [Terriglobus saanensis]ADV84870.1 DNA-cytosine methyltransferase [Terriglobus saanensis SP1PR4]